MATMTSAPNPGPRVLVVGATSAIANAVARLYAARGARIFLAARQIQALRDAAADLQVRGAVEVRHSAFEATATDSHAALVAEAWQTWQGLDVALIAHGILPDQRAAEASAAVALASFDVNARSVVSLATELANRFEVQGSGVIGIISSPAGDRGRASNYVYGAAKAAVTNLCSGLRHRLYRKGVRVVTVVPGFVDTPMTAEIRKGALWARPERVALDVARALDHGNGELYTPWFWRPIMFIVRHLPLRLFLRTQL